MSILIIFLSTFGYCQILRLFHMNLMQYIMSKDGHGDFACCVFKETSVDQWNIFFMFCKKEIKSYQQLDIKL